MSAAHATAARIRGCFVGACSAATAAAAHSLGGGAVPGGSSIVVPTLACAVVDVSRGRCMPGRRPTTSGRRSDSLVAKLADWGIRMHMGFLFGWLNQLLLGISLLGFLVVDAAIAAAKANRAR